MAKKVRKKYGNNQVNLDKPNEVTVAAFTYQTTEAELLKAIETIGNNRNKLLAHFNPTRQTQVVRRMPKY